MTGRVRRLGVPDRITIAVGNEQVLVDRAVVTAISEILTSIPEATRIDVNSADDNSSFAIDQACAPTLFGEDVVVVITGIDNLNDDGVDTLKRVLAEVPENVWLVLTHPGGVKRKPLIDAAVKAGGSKIECKELRRGKDTIDYLIKEVTRRRRKMTSPALTLLYESIGQDLPALTNAIGQLCSDVEGDPIDVGHVRAYFDVTASVSGFAIADAVWERRAAEALTLLRKSELEGDIGRVGVMTVTALASGLRSLIVVGGSAPGASDNDVARDAGVPPWKVRTLRHQWARWSGDQRRLAAMLVLLAEADPAMKGGLTPGSSLDPEQKLFHLESLVTRASG